MNPEQTRAFVKLIREHFRLQADIRMLAAILESAATFNHPPFGWLEALRLGRSTPEYRNISQQYAQQLAHIEQSAEATELDQLIRSIPPTEFLN
jgi:hypothetical protein